MSSHIMSQCSIVRYGRVWQHDMEHERILEHVSSKDMGFSEMKAEKALYKVAAALWNWEGPRGGRLRSHGAASLHGLPYTGWK